MRFLHQRPFERCRPLLSLTRDLAGPASSLAPQRAKANLKAPEPSLTRLDLAKMINDGDAAFTANESATKSIPPEILDGDLKSLVRSNNLNPYVITLSFKSDANVRSVRVHPSHAPDGYELTVYSSPETRGLQIEEVPNEKWSRLDLKGPATNTLRIELYRKQPSDHFVHLNELEIYVQREKAD